MDWTLYLEAGEIVRWEGRPAPRCFVFRNWRHSVFGLLLLLLSTWWQAVGYQLGALYDSLWLVCIPLPFVLLSLYLAVGHVLVARWEWERVFYVVTDRRILVRRGLLRRRFLTMDLSEVTCLRVKPYGQELATVRVISSPDRRPLTLSCIEYPARVTALLESALARNGRLAQEPRASEGGAGGGEIV